MGNLRLGILFLENTSNILFFNNYNYLIKFSTLRLFKRKLRNFK